MNRNSFNPSVGILFVQTKSGAEMWSVLVKFQSLGRDSVRSDLNATRYTYTKKEFQSLGRDSVRSDCPGNIAGII